MHGRDDGRRGDGKVPDKLVEAVRPRGDDGCRAARRGRRTAVWSFAPGQELGGGFPSRREVPFRGGGPGPAARISGRWKPETVAVPRAKDTELRP